MLGTYPTRVQLLRGLSTRKTELWVKRDDATGSLYGGNKVRKLEHLLDAAREKGATRIVTMGAVGSNHVLATTLYGRRAGFRVGAVLTPQPITDHVLANIRVGVGAGLETYVARSPALVPAVLLRALGKGDYFVGPGGSNVAGSLGFVDAARELAEQIARGEIPMPDAIVVALGSGGTVAGLLAGVASLSLPTKIIGVRVVSPVLMGALRAVTLASRVSQRMGFSTSWSDLERQFEMEPRYLGAGYGHRSPAGERATMLARDEGIALDPTYTAKTFAAALDVVKSGCFRRVLYWHTLSSASLDALLTNAPVQGDLPAELRALFA